MDMIAMAKLPQKIQLSFKRIGRTKNRSRNISRWGNNRESTPIKPNTAPLAPTIGPANCAGNIMANAI